MLYKHMSTPVHKSYFICTEMVLSVIILLQLLSSQKLTSNIFIHRMLYFSLSTFVKRSVLATCAREWKKKKATNPA
jgi:hypothetical protein